MPKFDLNQLIAQSNQAETYFADITSHYLNLTVHKNNHWTWLYSQDRTLVSIMDNAEPAHIITENNQIMLASLALLNINPFVDKLKVLNLGLGGAGFERFFSHHCQQLDMTTVEIDAALVAGCKAYFQLPHNIDINIASADVYIEQRAKSTSPSYQLILCDIFSGRRHPSCITQPTFYQHLAAILADDGILTINLMPESEQQLLQILLIIRAYFPHSLLSQVNGARNIVLILSKQPLNLTIKTEHLQDYQYKLNWDITQCLATLTLLPSR